jgi:hypothetical protein
MERASNRLLFSPVPLGLLASCKRQFFGIMLTFLTPDREDAVAQGFSPARTREDAVAQGFSPARTGKMQ